MDTLGSVLSRPEFFLPLLLWSFFWKGWALWKSAGKRQLLWFVIILIINTFSLLEIAYIFYLNRFDLDGGRTLAYLEKKFKRGKK